MASKAVLVVAAVVALGACSRTDDGKIVVNRPGEVEVKTTQDTINPPVIGTTKDTIEVPTIEIGKKKQVVTRPTVGTKP